MAMKTISAEFHAPEMEYETRWSLVRWSAQLILVAHAAHGVSVRFFNGEEFFPIEYVHIVLFHTQCVILHTHYIILHTLCNFTHTLYNFT